MPDHVWLGVRNALAIATPVAVGLYAWREGPHARFGVLLVLAGLAWFPVALGGSTDPLAYSIARIAGWISEVIIIYLLLAFPSGRLQSRIDRMLLGVAALLVFGLFVPTALLVESYPTPTWHVSCLVDCPRNALTLLDATPRWVADVVVPVREIGAIVLAVLVVARLADRLRRATPLLRRTLTPVLWVAILRLVMLGGTLLLRRIGVLDDRALRQVTGPVALTLVILSLAFLVGLLRWRLYVADTLIALGRRMWLAHGAGERRVAIAEAVRDPTLEVAYPRPHGDGWVDARGRPLTLPDGRGDRAATLVVDGSRPVAALTHDAALIEQRSFIEAVGSYALVWDENERLAARVDSSTSELRASRARILAAADEERRRIERDLHDGGQQRLVALRIRLQLAEEMMASGRAAAPELFGRLADDVDGILEELRHLAAGVFPARLAAHGLADAVRAVAMEAPLPVQVTIDGAGRYPPETETAAYFCCVEALQNVAKHAAEATRAQLLLALDGDLVFEVSDDGAGFDPQTVDAHGLVNMRDRVAALGGRLEIASAPGSGTRIRGVLPGAAGAPQAA